PLKELQTRLTLICGIKITFDSSALEEANIDLEKPLSLRVESISLKSALNILLKQAKLTFQVTEDGLVITTPEPPRKLQIVTYPVSDLITPVAEQVLPIVCQFGGKYDPKKTQEEALIRLITHVIEPNSWKESGGEGEIHYF